MNTPRTDAEYFCGFDKSHQIDNCVSPLKYLGLLMVRCVPFEYMHLICRGVMKRYLLAILQKKRHFCKHKKSRHQRS